MWRAFRSGSRGFRGFVQWPSARIYATKLGIATSFVLAGGSLVLNDVSPLKEGISVDSGIDPFPTELTRQVTNAVGSDYKLIASGVRSVTFLSFKVYGVGLYVKAEDEKKIRAIIADYSKSEGKSVAELLQDKDTSEQVVDKIAQNVSYALKITPVRNTDYGHLRDGLTKSILASPMGKKLREQVSEGVEELRGVFSGHKGSVPKNHTLWVVSDTRNTTISYEGKGFKTLGSIANDVILRVLLVLYLSSAKPLSEPLRKDFVAYVEGQL